MLSFKPFKRNNYSPSSSNWYNGVDKYLSPLSGNTARTFLPLPSFFAIFLAAATAAPEEIPPKIPSFLATSRDAENASSLDMRTTSSYTSVSNTFGTNHNPSHIILCRTGVSPDKTDESSGSTA